MIFRGKKCTKNRPLVTLVAAESCSAVVATNELKDYLQKSFSFHFFSFHGPSLPFSRLDFRYKERRERE
jgi:hypothetical protein